MLELRSQHAGRILASKRRFSDRGGNAAQCDGRRATWAGAVAGEERQSGTGVYCPLIFWLTRSDVFELRASAVLLSGRLQRPFLIRLAILVGSGTALLVASGWIVLAIAVAGECLGRWLFFVSVVPKNTAAAFPTSPSSE